MLPVDQGPEVRAGVLAGEVLEPGGVVQLEVATVPEVVLQKMQFLEREWEQLVAFLALPEVGLAVSPGGGAAFQVEPVQPIQAVRKAADPP